MGRWYRPICTCASMISGMTTSLRLTIPLLVNKLTQGPACLRTLRTSAPRLFIRVPKGNRSANQFFLRNPQHLFYSCPPLLLEPADACADTIRCSRQHHTFAQSPFVESFQVVLSWFAIHHQHNTERGSCQVTRVPFNFSQRLQCLPLVYRH